MRWSTGLRIIMALCAFSVYCVTPVMATGQDGRDESADRAPHAVLRQRLERALDRWCRWLAGYLYRVPDTDFYTLGPTLGTGRNPYRDVAGHLPPERQMAALVWLGQETGHNVTRVGTPCAEEMSGSDGSQHPGGLPTSAARRYPLSPR